MSLQNLTLEIEGVTAVLSLNRPNKRNALSLELMRELIEVLTELDRQPVARAIILAAAGPVFCAGHDISEMLGCAEKDYRRLFDVCTELMQKIQSVHQPVIAEVQGLATAAGCQLAASCDLVVAAEDASFATPGVKIGLFCSTPMVALSRAVGQKRALQMLLTGTPIDAETAAEWGLVNYIVPKGELREATLKLAARITTASPVPLAIGKQAFYAQAGLDSASAYEIAKQAMIQNALTQDAQEGMNAFLGKRLPVWTGK